MQRIQMQRIISQTTDFVRKHHAGKDGSHDFAHVDRVRQLALRLASSIRGIDMHVVELAALLHDVNDYKYSTDTGNPPPAPAAFLESIGCNPATTARVAAVLDRLGFKKTAFMSESEKKLYLDSLSDELRCVQDVDYLDAIGAIGIARCFTFGGMRNRPLYYEEDLRSHGARTLSEKEYSDKNRGSTVAHFYEKLITLKDRMLTEAGKKEAERRHKFMLEYLAELAQDVAPENIEVQENDAL